LAVDGVTDKLRLIFIVFSFFIKVICDQVKHASLSGLYVRFNIGCSLCRQELGTSSVKV